MFRILYNGPLLRLWGLSTKIIIVQKCKFLRLTRCLKKWVRSTHQQDTCTLTLYQINKIDVYVCSKEFSTACHDCFWNNSWVHETPRFSCVQYAGNKITMTCLLKNSFRSDYILLMWRVGNNCVTSIMMAGRLRLVWFMYILTQYTRCST
jgi:hypothetical protein